MSLDEPTMLGPTPEEKQHERQRRKRLRIVAAVVVIILAVAIGISLIPTTPSKNVYVDQYDSACHPGATFSCTIVLDARQGNVTVSDVKRILINGTNPTDTVKPDGGSVSIAATLPSIDMTHGLPDVGASVHPPSVGNIVVYLSDGTTVSVLLGPAGIVGKGPGP
jgi:hypothetical protein